MSHATPSTLTFGQRLWAAFVVLLRGVFLLVIMLAFGLLLYWSLPRIYTNFIQPVQEHSAQIEDLQTQQDQLAQQLIEQNATLGERIQTLETQNDLNRQTIANLNAQIEALNAELQKTVAAQETSAGRILTLRQYVESLDKSLQPWEARFSALEQQITTQQEGLTLLSNYLMSTEAPLTTLYREVQLVKAMQLLTRSRVSIELGDTGLARQDVQAAYDLLAALRPIVFGDQTPALEAILTRIELTLNDFDAAPSLVPNDLENAWQLLLAGLPDNSLPVQNNLQIVVTPELTFTETVEIQPEPTESVAPTPTPTAAP
ncbi:MAG: hypothetical protein Fur0018_01050 [Anaerolineales bacterium]